MEIMTQMGENITPNCGGLRSTDYLLPFSSVLLKGLSRLAKKWKCFFFFFDCSETDKGMGICSKHFQTYSFKIGGVVQ